MKKIRGFFSVILLFTFVVVLKGERHFSPLSENGQKVVVSHTLHKHASASQTTAPDIDLQHLSKVDSIVRDAMHRHVFPGCQVLVLKDGVPVYDKCFGKLTYESTEKVTPETLYDLASLSKTTGTLLAVMKLYDNHKLQLTDRASKYLSFLQGTNKEDITIEQLLFHESGLPASLSFERLVIQKKNGLDTESVSRRTPHLRSKLYEYNPALVSKTPSPEFSIQVSDSLFLKRTVRPQELKMMADAPLRAKTYLYSCVNFMLLKEIVEKISGQPLDSFLNQNFYRPMQLQTMCYLPLRTHQKEEIAPTLERDYLREGAVWGYVHDPAAAFLGGVSGNAGLFANAGDVAQIYQMLLNDGELNGKRYLSTETCRLFTTKTSVSGRRGLGFDKPVPSQPKIDPCCTEAPAAVYGHTGYTGTCCWVDPVNHLVYVFLSNRTYPDDRVNLLARLNIRPKIQKVIYQSIHH